MRGHACSLGGFPSLELGQSPFAGDGLKERSRVGNGNLFGCFSGGPGPVSTGLLLSPSALYWQGKQTPLWPRWNQELRCPFCTFNPSRASGFPTDAALCQPSPTWHQQTRHCQCHGASPCCSPRSHPQGTRMHLPSSFQALCGSDSSRLCGLSFLRLQVVAL